MSDIYRNRSHIMGTNGVSGYDQGNRVDYGGKTYYADDTAVCCVLSV